MLLDVEFGGIGLGLSCRIGSERESNYSEK
jgi:hypothetical protein